MMYVITHPLLYCISKLLSKKILATILTSKFRLGQVIKSRSSLKPFYLTDRENCRFGNFANYIYNLGIEKKSL